MQKISTLYHLAHLWQISGRCMMLSTLFILILFIIMLIYSFVNKKFSVDIGIVLCIVILFIISGFGISNNPYRHDSNVIQNDIKIIQNKKNIPKEKHNAYIDHNKEIHNFKNYKNMNKVIKNGGYAYNLSQAQKQKHFNLTHHYSHINKPKWYNFII